MRRSRILRGLPIAGLLWLMLLPGAATAFPLTGVCSMQATSVDAKGESLDTAASGNGSASEAAPFKVDSEGAIKWTGAVTTALPNATWHVDIFGIPVQSGSGGGTSLTGSGTVSLKDLVPFPVTGKYHVTGAITSAAGTCEGDGWFEIVGNPVGTPLFFLDLGLLVTALILLVLGAGAVWIVALLGGLTLGAALALGSVLFGITPLGSATPEAAIVLGVLIGAAELVVGKGLLHWGTDAPPAA